VALSGTEAASGDALEQPLVAGHAARFVKFALDGFGLEYEDLSAVGSEIGHEIVLQDDFVVDSALSGFRVAADSQFQVPSVFQFGTRLEVMIWEIRSEKDRQTHFENEYHVAFGGWRLGLASGRSHVSQLGSWCIAPRAADLAVPAEDPLGTE